MLNIPSFVSKLLWDVNVKTDLTHNGAFVIERVLEFGDTDSLVWLNKNYDKDLIAETLKKSRRISTKSGNFYALYYGVDKQLLQCMRKPFTQKQNRF